MAGMVTVDYPDGSRIVVRFEEPPVNPRAKQIADKFLDSLTEHEREMLVLILAEDIHDNAVYERVCERKGLLAL